MHNPMVDRKKGIRDTRTSTEPRKWLLEVSDKEIFTVCI